jgi:hypothetical protein
MAAKTARAVGWFWTGALLTCIAAYVVVLTVVGRFVGIDEVFFKAPGREWAASGHFAAPELTGVPFLADVDPPIETVWLVHPPAYPFLFGLFTKWCGFGPRQCIVYDALIHGMLALLTFVLGRRFKDVLPDWLAFLVALAVLPLGVVGRPDELATCFGVLGVLAMLVPVPSRAHVLCSGIMIGLSGATSVAAAVLLGVVAGTLLWTSGRRLVPVLGLSLLWGLTALLAFGLALAPVLSAYPNAYRQYLAHAAVHVGRGDWLNSFFANWEYEQFHRTITIACLSLAIVGATAKSATLTWARWGRLWLGPIAALLVVVVFLPDKVYYTWFLGPWMMVAGVVSWRSVWVNLHPLVLRGVVLWIAALYAMAASPCAKSMFLMATLPEAQTLAPNAQLIRDLVPPGSLVLTDHYWWVLGDDRRVYDRYFSRVPLDQIDYIVVVGDGSGDPNVVSDVPGHSWPEIFDRFERIHNNINTEPIMILGRPLPNTAVGFGAMVLQRK